MTLSANERPIPCTTSDQVSVDASGAVRSLRFDDIYFNPGQGAAEAQHVFIQGNQLEQRWLQALKNNNRNGNSSNATNHFIVGETGFGSGLNFLATVNGWVELHKHLPRSAQPRLYYYATEAFPLTLQAMKKVHAAYDPFPTYSAELRANYPDLVGSDYLIPFEFDGCTISLVLLLGDSCDALQRLEFYPSADITSSRTNRTNLSLAAPSPSPLGLCVDAWFLDGFAPSKNPNMWHTSLFTLIRRYSRIGSTVATFSVARPVRTGLSLAGFTLQKKTGFGRKREMLTATYAAKTSSLATALGQHEHDQPAPLKTRKSAFSLSPCFFRHAEKSHHEQTKTTSERPSALIIGAGIAGCSTASRLAQSGWQVTVLDRRARFADAASGNSAAVLYARTALQRSKLADFHEAAFHYAVNYYQQLESAHAPKSAGTNLTDHQQKRPANHLTTGLNGMLQLTEQLSDEWLESHPECHSRRNLNATAASTIAGATLSEPAIYYPRSGHLNPRAVCEFLLNDPAIKLLTSTAVDTLAYHANISHGQWQAHLNNANVLHADIVVVACGHASAEFAQTNWLKLKALRGQTSDIPASNRSAKLRVTLCEKGYTTPSIHGLHSIGATYNLGVTNTQVTVADHIENLSNAHRACASMPAPATHETLAQSIQGRANFRCVSPDYMPIAGSVVEPKAFCKSFTSLSHNAKQTPTNLAAPIPGLYINTGYGSHGFTMAPLATELLVAEINGSPVPLSDTLRQAISPSRFLVRQLIRSNANRRTNKSGAHE
ncbi:MAG: FAD-dependent 5-carboxymethylaminomethyl-2-thiouridine(34) oxidoreductase MnmC [Pseudomonadales bacterium]|nr:FAD-dependent 5-carboxymethylaminomethyl-2-thiouridine(34) oxidoreductase MnmC [Pseudomonadales bacterium]